MVVWYSRQCRWIGCCFYGVLGSFFDPFDFYGSVIGATPWLSKREYGVSQKVACAIFRFRAHAVCRGMQDYSVAFVRIVGEYLTVQ